ncbi:hypothetical protein BDP27DRAFT_1236981 [Rhodocollybia butyracea]|uniref:Uncharacterized protein n=1 Tax=Rhodocollybia butyracea TaxID=206335 RepID=A0A9P5PBL9_9AGAR|nr:hypothetical protein BDP27DRAFT_1236981 [Rhodocollybia butyracea]
MQTSFRSWWLRPAAWKVCGLNCGYWSRDAEQWFQTRLEHIPSSTPSGTIYTNNKWRPKLKFNKDVAYLSANNDRLATEYL